MNIFLRELKANSRSLIIWSVIVILFVLVGTSKFSAYYENPEMLVILDDLPPAMLEAFNMRAFNLTTVTGFFGLMFTYYGLMLSIAAVMWGSDIISKEERDKTVEFTLTLPVTRGHLITTKALAALVNCAGLLLVTWGASMVSATPYQPDSEFYKFVGLCMVALFIMQMLFLAVGIFLGCAIKQYRRVSSIAVSLLLGTYFLSILPGLDQNLDFVKYFSPFKYFDAGMLLRESRFDVKFILLSLTIIVASMVGAYLTYARRDLYI
jgi:ABC-2 type transport system permease protein